MCVDDSRAGARDELYIEVEALTSLSLEADFYFECRVVVVVVVVVDVACVPLITLVY